MLFGAAAAVVAAAVVVVFLKLFKLLLFKLLLLMFFLFLFPFLFLFLFLLLLVLLVLLDPAPCVLMVHLPPPAFPPNYAWWAAVYVVGCEHDHIKDVTLRYAGASALTHAFRRARVEAEWWQRTLAPFQNEDMQGEDAEEDLGLSVQQQTQALPTTLAALKGHDLFVVESHLGVTQCVAPGGKCLCFCVLAWVSSCAFLSSMCVHETV